MKHKKIVEQQNLNIEMQLNGVTLLSSNQILSTADTINIRKFNFNINIETKADAPNKLLFAIIHVEILTEDHSQILGGISVSCNFELNNFDALIKIDSDGKLTLPQQLIDVINSISLSTTRGVMFATFKGTPLHNAFLPIIDPKQFKSSL
jgi:glycosylphosphatidylinositol transamidase (GPIT) subunit GPI8